MDDKAFEKLIKTAEDGIKPQEGLQERVLKSILGSDGGRLVFKLTAVENFLFSRPLGTAMAVSVIISLLLWTVMGSGYSTYLVNMAGSR